MSETVSKPKPKPKPKPKAAAAAPRPFLALATARPKPGQTVPSPCVSICRMSPDSGLCEGCWRTLEELRAWKASDDDAKRAIWRLVEQRQELAGVPR